MGKRKRFRAAEKTVQKISRDGLLCENKATGEVNNYFIYSSMFVPIFPRIHR